MTGPPATTLPATTVASPGVAAVGSPRGLDFDGRVVVHTRRSESDGVVSLQLENASGTPLPGWAPGAHIDLVLPNGLVRQYSLCGPAADCGTWRIGVLREPAGRGGSAWIHDNAQAGTELHVRGPRNNFALRAASRYVFIAGGIGITPLLSMVAAAEAAGADWTLHYGGRRRASMAFLDELARYGDRVRVRPEDEFGMLDLAAILSVPSPSTLVYCCGPAGLIDAVESRCTSWASGALHVERFAAAASTVSPSVSAVSAVSASGEGGNRPIEVECRRSGITLTVPPELSILQVVEEAGLGVLSSCAEGICGTCETAVLDGEVDHRDSLLTDDERATNDMMMICVSRARHDRLVLDL
ncbi:PDR/VanB family oxidoreductase [Frankia sp. Cas4]|uniref:PDR/VanB family oxidoreductase n=1 Tax=Frankia sp. Cas4 TaxID=3073927 RepID=UPI002AD55869|nr:PDR/VanB family oxidoreductase [Frankia sp. Cas4]